MTAHLLAISVGPVQEFIAAARRTRDLWFGSYLLSEISKATAKAVHEQRGTLIFPAPGTPADLDTDSPLNVANVILAALDDADPQTVARLAKEAAERRWLQFARNVYRANQGAIRDDIWNDQVDDVIEFYAAWMPNPDGDEGYQTARRRVMRLLASRKNCRDFLPAKGRPGVPKSSLDGLRESALKDPEIDPWPKFQHRRLRVREGEQLDVVGLVKRTAEGHWPCPSVARVAADPWLRGLTAGAANAEVLRPLCDACDALGEEVIHRLDTSADRGHPHYAEFAYEGTAVFRSRHGELREEAEMSEADFQALNNALGALIRSFGEPNPYLAVLVADGDRMGQALSRLKRAEEHREFSQQLSRFADEARQIVHGYHGVLVYAGGDDVLAFVPVAQCLACARALHERFGTLMQPWTEKTETTLTLSVGLAIAHFMDNLEDLLNYGRQAERHAKTPRPEDGEQVERNALAVHLLKRGGGPIRVRGNWSDASDNGRYVLDRRLAELAGYLKCKAIPGQVTYDLHLIADVYDGWPPETVAAAIQGDVQRIILAKQPRGESKMDEIKLIVKEEATNAVALRRFADTLLVARQIATAMGQADGRPATEEVLT